MTEDTHYLLGHTPEELARLDTQGDLYRDITFRAFRAGGLVSGMRVLDIGCGTGDVSLAAAEFVGPEGSVVGVDRGESALGVAREKARVRGLANVSFRTGEISDLDAAGAFDALIGRFVLMHQPDPVSVLASAARAVRPGGVVLMIESWMELLRSGPNAVPPSELYDGIVRWKSALVEGAGADVHAGGRLPKIFRDAGLRDAEARLESVLVTDPESPYHAYVAGSVRSMLPEAARIGLEGMCERDADGIEAAMRDELRRTSGGYLMWPVVAVSAIVPGG